MTRRDQGEWMEVGGHEAHRKREPSVRKANSLFFFAASSTHNTVCFTASHGALGLSVQCKHLITTTTTVTED